VRLEPWQERLDGGEWGGNTWEHKVVRLVDEACEARERLEAWEERLDIDKGENIT